MLKAWCIVERCVAIQLTLVEVITRTWLAPAATARAASSRTTRPNWGMGAFRASGRFSEANNTPPEIIVAYILDVTACLNGFEKIYFMGHWTSNPLLCTRTIVVTKTLKIMDDMKPMVHVDGLVQDCSNSSALAMELLQSCTKPSIWLLQDVLVGIGLEWNTGLVLS